MFVDAIVVTRVFVTIGLFLSCGTLSLTLLCLFISEVASHEYVHIGTILISISTGKYNFNLTVYAVFVFCFLNNDFS